MEIGLIKNNFSPHPDKLVTPEEKKKAIKRALIRCLIQGISNAFNREVEHSKQRKEQLEKSIE